YYQNLTIPEAFSSNTATFSFNYKYTGNLLYPPNGSIYMAIIVDGIEKNKTISFNEILIDQWGAVVLQYNPIQFGQALPGAVSVRGGVYIDADCSKGGGGSDFYIDTIKFDPWTEPNEEGLIKIYDVENYQTYSYSNLTYGKGTTFINVQRSAEFTRDIIFTISSNFSDYLDFSINEVEIVSAAVKLFNSSYLGESGSYYSLANKIKWQFDISIFIPTDYFSWVELEKPQDWNFTSIVDGYSIEQVENCVGGGYNSENLIIPSSILVSGIWHLYAESNNYILKGNVGVLDEGTFKIESKMTFGDVFNVNITLNSTLALTDTYINCTIYYPNASIFIYQNKEPSSHNVIFGNFHVDSNMTIGEYTVIIQWTNNLLSSERTKVGYKQLKFKVWHHTNLTAITPYIEALVGDPLLLKVKFYDFELNTSIHFATITYNSTFGPFGTMIYLGSGVYFIDVDTNSLELGDYYFSFNASKAFYENQTMDNLIHLKIVAEPLSLEVPHSALEGNANSIISCRINTTGAISGTKIYPVNLSTDWFNPYNITDHNNGTYTIDFSTVDIPTSGFLESFNIEIFANKTNYGDTYEFITLLVHPLATLAKLNTSLVSVNSNNIVNVKVNYTIESSGEIIMGSNCSVTWQSSFLITPVSDGFNIRLSTTGLAVDYYTALIKLEKAGYEVAFETLTVIIIEQEINLTVSINSEEIPENILIDSFFQQTINITARAYAIIDEEFLSGGVITLLSNNYQKNLTETPFTYFFTSLILDGANFDSGINTIFLRFEQANYTTKIFPFQLFIRAQNVNLSTQINYQEIHENYLLEQIFNQEFQISCRAFVDIEGVYLSGGNITFVNGEYEVALFENVDYWFNQTIIISTSLFTIGPNYVYLRFEQNNYTTTIFAFQIFVNQVEINVETIDFEGLISGVPGGSVLIRLNLTESGSSNFIENATVFYSWNFGAGYFNYLGNGIYENKLSLPSGFEGNYNFKIIISKEGVLYKTKEFAFFIEIRQLEGPNIIIWIIIISLIAIVGILGALSLRSYVIIPKRREREAELLGKIQVYKDVWNIRAVVVIHRKSGLPVFSKDISIMEKGQDSFLISGFVQAITAFSESFVEKEFRAYSKLATDYEYLKSIIDLDFKFFQLLVCDHETVRVLVVLRDEASERLKKQIYLLANALHSQFGEEFRNFSGTLNHLYKPLDEYLNKFLFLYFNNSFEMTPNKNYLNSLIESGELTKLEKRLINVITSMTKIKKQFTLREAIELIDEVNEDLVLEAINTLILQKLILSPYSSKLVQKKE
ncbi:MAG: hypothetical protein ACFE8G_11200, partial [Candidatus Hermodarchaeota archaeon]